MNRIAYFAHCDVRFESGVTQKIASQIRVWQSAGKDVRLFALSRSNEVWAGFGDIPVSVVSSSRMRHSLSKSYLIFEQIAEWNPDLLYYRYGLYLPRAQSIMHQFPTVLEMNNDDLAEYRAKYPLWAFVYHKLTRDKMLSTANAMVLISYEMSECYKHYGKPLLVVSNGIDLSQCRIAPAPRNQNPTLVLMVGNPHSTWHGLDKIVFLSDKFPDWQFDVIGAEKQDLGLSSTPSNLRFHGNMPQSQYQAILDQADIGIGTLALHRKGMAEASPLKVRSYLASGLPVIIGYQDTDFTAETPFLLQLPNVESNIASNLLRIEDFVLRWKGRRISRDDIQHLDVAQKELLKISFFETILAEVRS